MQFFGEPQNCMGPSRKERAQDDSYGLRGAAR